MLRPLRQQVSLEFVAQSQRGPLRSATDRASGTMRCTPVGEWQTRRPPYTSGQERITPAQRIEKLGSKDEKQAQHGPAQRQHHTYANSYDVGFIFEALHKRRILDNIGGRIHPGRRITQEEMMIPETVVYKGGFPAQWYFHSKVDGRFMKKKPHNITIPQIFDVFGAENGACETQVVAVFVGTLAGRNQVVYFDRKKLKDFLFAETAMKDGFLQRFVAPEGVPFDSGARNSTLHAVWSRYNCRVELRVNKMKLDNQKHSVAEKVNMEPTRTHSTPVNKNSMLQRKIEESCKFMAEHIQATTSDRAEVTNITAYFKVGEHNKLWMLFASSVTVAPKFQDAYGYIPSLKTFTGRHSPIITCPDHMNQDDNERTPRNASANCNMCNLSNKADEKSSSYAITYRQLADYIELERDRLLEEMRGSALVEVQVSGSPLNKRRNGIEDEHLAAKAGALFTVLDTDRDNRMPIVELWSGLIDLGYSHAEISAILMLQHKMNYIKVQDNSIDTFKVAEGSQAAEAKSNLAACRVSDAGENVEVPDEGKTHEPDIPKAGGMAEVLEVKKHFPEVTLEEFREGMKVCRRAVCDPCCCQLLTRLPNY